MRKKDARKEVIANSINEVRDIIIKLELEIKFDEEIKEMIKSKIDKDNEQHSIDAMNECDIRIANNKGNLEVLLLRLNFFKRQREELNTKKAMRSYNKFPKVISTDELVEIEESNKA